jgi:hypothetical protein
MLLTTILIAINNVIGQAIASMDKMWLGFLFNLIWGIAILISSYYLVIIKKQGVLGLCYSYLISYVIHTVVQYGYLIVSLKMKKTDNNLKTNLEH